jgi:hypothetical protein
MPILSQKRRAGHKRRGRVGGQTHQFTLQRPFIVMPGLLPNVRTIVSPSYSGKFPMKKVVELVGYFGSLEGAYAVKSHLPRRCVMGRNIGGVLSGSPTWI